MLKQRIITALMIGLPLLGVLFFAPPLFTVGLFAMIVLLGAWEWSGLLALRSKSYRGLYLLLVFICMAIAWRYLRESDALPLLLQVAWLWWLAVLLWIGFIPECKSKLATVLAGVLTLVPAWLSIAVLVLLNPQWVLFVLLLVISVDVGAYLCGRRYGRNKLAPRVSPGKTWEGVLGGVLSSLLVMLLGAFWFDQFSVAFFIVGLLTVVVSIVGDLSESLFKRQAGLKDSGNILPGHGGILDRIDSITAAAPVFLYGLMYLGVFVT